MRISAKVLFIVLAGLLLVQFFYNRSLWMDEAMLALNIIQRNFTQLLQPLDYYQVAPVLFLWTEKLMTDIFGSSEMALRLFPLLCGLGALFMIHRLCLVFFDNRIIALIALCVLGCSPAFIYYSSEVKQYMVDLFVLLLVYNAAFGEKVLIRNNRGLILSLIGAVAVFMSSVAVISLFVVGGWLLIDGIRKKRLAAGMIIAMVVWLVCIGVNYLFFVKDHPHLAFMQQYWKDSFLPLRSASGLARWSQKKISQVFYELLASGPWKKFYLVTILLYLFGAVQLWMGKQFRLLYLCVAPVVVHLLLSALNRYPFDLRLILYLAPLFIMVVSYGLYRLAVLMFKNLLLQRAFMVCIVVLMCLAVTRQYPLKREELRLVLQQVEGQVHPGETVYVYEGGLPAFRYYELTGGVHFTGDRVIFGKMRTDDPHHYLSDVDSLQGPVWFLFSHIYPRPQSEAMEHEMLNQLRQGGTLRSEVHSYDASAYLFDMK